MCLGIQSVTSIWWWQDHQEMGPSGMKLVQNPGLFLSFPFLDTLSTQLHLPCAPTMMYSTITNSKWWEQPTINHWNHNPKQSVLPFNLLMAMGCKLLHIIASLYRIENILCISDSNGTNQVNSSYKEDWSAWFIRYQLSNVRVTVWNAAEAGKAEAAQSVPQQCHSGNDGLDEPGRVSDHGFLRSCVLDALELTLLCIVRHALKFNCLHGTMRWS